MTLLMLTEPGMVVSRDAQFNVVESPREDRCSAFVFVALPAVDASSIRVFKIVPVATEQHKVEALFGLFEL